MQPASSPPGTSDERGRWVLLSLGIVADIGGLIALASSGTKVFVAAIGILAMLAGTIAILREWNKPVRSMTLFMVTLVAVGAGILGAIIDRAAVSGRMPSGHSDPVAQPSLTRSTTPPLSTAQESSSRSTEPQLTLPTTTTATPTVRRMTDANQPLILSRGYSADLDSIDPAWEVLYGATSNSYDVAFTLGGAGQLVSPGTGDLAVVTGEPSYATCRSTTGYGGGVDADTAVAGLRLCVKTSDSRLAFVAVRSVGPGREQITLDVIIWDPPLK